MMIRRFLCLSLFLSLTACDVPLVPLI